MADTQSGGTPQSIQFDAPVAPASPTSIQFDAPVASKDTSTIGPAKTPGVVSFNPRDIFAGPEGGIGGSPIGNPIHVDTTPIENYTPEGREEHPVLAKLGNVTKGVKELLFGGQAAGKPEGTSSGVVNNPVTQAMSLAPGAAEVGAGAEDIAAEKLATRAASKAKKIEEAAKAAKSVEVTPEHFTYREEGATPQHGTPVKTAQPLDDATIRTMPHGKTLSSDAVDALQSHVGGEPGAEIEAGSTEKNTLYKASEPLQKTLNDTGLKMNKVIDHAPAFKSSTIADEAIALPKEIAAVRDNLPLKLEDPLNKVVDTQMEAAYSALESTDPAEVLAYRRKLGDQIDWSNISHSPETTGEAKNLTQVKIYNALGNKLHLEIPQTAELDKVFQPNLELRTFLDKNGVPRDAAQANAEHLSELKKGQNQLATKAHNDVIAKNRELAGMDRTDVQPTIGASGPKSTVGTTLDKAVAKFKLPATEQPALRQLLQPTVKPGRLFGANQSWYDGLKAFDNLTPAEQAARFKDPDAVRAMLRSQTTKQWTARIAAGVSITALAHEMGLDEAVFRAMLHAV